MNDVNKDTLAQTEARVTQTAQPKHASRAWLSPLVFVAHTRHGAVLLDLVRNRYLGISHSETSILQTLVQDWPKTAAHGPSPTQNQVDEDSLLSSLVAEGILRTDATEPRTIDSEPVSLNGVLVAIGDEIERPVSVQMGHVAVVVWALLSRIIALRFGSISSTAQAIRERRIANQKAGRGVNVAHVIELVCVFRRIRPYLFAARGHCLLHSLTLIRFLAHYDEFPLLVLGVRVDPWSAHAWVQHENLLLDTNPEKVCTFNPILAL
jgi:hypothetical protein